MKDILWNMTQIPGRLTSAAVERVVAGADEIYDDTLDKRQSELNAEFKAITDQMRISINGGTAEIANTPESIAPGSGAIPTANAIALLIAQLQPVAGDYLKGTMSVVEVAEDMTVAEADVAEGSQLGIIYRNTASGTVRVTIPATTFATPDGVSIVMEIPADGYGEASYLKLNDTIYARGC